MVTMSNIQSITSDGKGGDYIHLHSGLVVHIPGTIDDTQYVALYTDRDLQLGLRPLCQMNENGWAVNADGGELRNDD